MASNPILPGFYPDPSICRAGDRYVLANSSFQYLPGIPLHESKSLREWTLIGHAFSRPEQLDLSDTPSNAGLYAPTIRYRDGLFYVVTSDLMTAKDGHLIVHAEDPAGPWSDPVRTNSAIGIDPDLFWDIDGTCYLSWKGVSSTGLSGILSAPVDPLSGTLTGKVRKLWQGSGTQASPEGPHLYRRGEYYYCLLAEGGTERTHSATIARARSLDGPWEECPANPILTHRGTPSEVQNTGHADLIEHADGRWAAVYLGVRPRGFVPKFHVNGRETFLADVHWENDWPVIVESSGGPVVDTGFVEDFSGDALDPRWVSHGGAHREHTHLVDGGLSIHQVGSDPHLPALGVRARDESWLAEAEFSRAGALQVHMDTENWVEISAQGKEVRVHLSTVGIHSMLGTLHAADVPRALIVSAVPWPAEGGFNQGPDMLVFSIRDATDTVHEVARLDGRLLSTEVTAGFTGRMIGMRALGRRCLLRGFEYRPLKTAREKRASPFRAS